jgi:rhamnulokinase
MYHLAIDIGASSGRHILGHLENGKIVLEEIYRFPNRASVKNGHLVWDIDQLFREILHGMQACKASNQCPVTVGIDTWAVDFVLLDQHGQRLGDAVSYRDSRTAGMDTEIQALISDADLYARTGIQKQCFNTIYQLKALGEQLQAADRLMMIPDYFHFLLTGVQRFEYTNASSTGLLDAKKRDWDRPLLDLLGYPQRLFPALHFPGDVVGPLKPEIAALVGFQSTVVLPATHDTGSAFLAVPAKNDTSVYLSSGTWSLLGVENQMPITTEASRLANFTNEGGYQGRYRYLKNIMGLWMIQCIQKEAAPEQSFQQLMALAETSTFSGIVDVNAPAFLAPDSMIAAIQRHCADHGQPVPETLPDLLRCVYHSLAVCYRNAIAQLSSLTGTAYTAIHIVGGGSKASLLNRLTAQETGLPVYAGPDEGTALGNLLAQMLYAGEFENLAAARAAVLRSFAIQEVDPCVI